MVLVIGNGESRASIDLTKYKNVVPLIGCNAIHRELDVDHLVCCDKRMVKEALDNNIQNIYTRNQYYQEYNVKKLPALPYQGTQKQDLPEHWGSGSYAVLLAASLNFNTVRLVGFDLYGKNQLVNNIYKNTPNYLKDTADAVDPSFWVYQLRKIFVHYPNTKFKIFNLEDWKMPAEWTLPNVESFFISSL